MTVMYDPRIEPINDDNVIDYCSRCMGMQEHAITVTIGGYVSECNVCGKVMHGVAQYYAYVMSNQEKWRADEQEDLLCAERSVSLA